jgi:hypothetical protein
MDWTLRGDVDPEIQMDWTLSLTNLRSGFPDHDGTVSAQVGSSDRRLGRAQTVEPPIV